MKKYGITLALTAAVAVTMVAPQGAEAGSKEWATAGKILAGVTALHVLTDGGNGHRNTVRVEEHYYRDSRHPSSYGRYYSSSSGCRNPSSYGRYSSSHRTTYRRSSFRSHGNANVCGKCRHSTCRCGPVIIEISKCRRLYQPRIRGHVSYLQEWDDCRREWCTIGTRDSIY